MTSVDSSRPPGPLHELALDELRDHPLEFLTDLTERHGDLCSHVTGGETVYVLNRPDLAQHVLRDRYTDYTKAGTPDDLMLSPLLGDGLLTSSGETWARQRKQCAPAFRRAEVESFDEVIVRAATDLVRQWERRADLGEPVRVDHDLTALTLRVVVAALLGVDLTELGNGFGQAVDAVNRFFGHHDGTVPGPEMRELHHGYLQAKAFLDRVVRVVVAARRFSVDVPSTDLLGKMLGSSSDGELHHQVLTMIMAGHETTAKALSWTLHLLALHPSQAAAVRAELATTLGGAAPTAADLPRLVRTRQVIDEAIRLYPPVWLISRRAVTDDVIDGYRVPAGSLVCISPWTLHRHPAFWDRPAEFLPSRFEPAAAAMRPSHLYLPFGGGPRICIGQAFALVEATLVLATLLPHIEVTHVPDHPVEPEALVTLRPRHGLLMDVRRHDR